MIINRPKYLENNIPHYLNFPKSDKFDFDYKLLPKLLNLDLHTLNGVLPLTNSRFDYIDPVTGRRVQQPIEVNPSSEEYSYFESIGITKFQAVQIVLQCHTVKPQGDGSFLGIPYSVSLIPMQKDGEIDFLDLELLKQFDLRELCQEGGYVYSQINPFTGWYGGLVSQYSTFCSLPLEEITDTLGFVWGMYFLAAPFKKDDIVMLNNSSYSKQINAKYSKHKTQLYYKPFDNIKPRRIWGCESPIELFLLQGLSHNGMNPEIQMNIYKNGEVIPNYYKMQETELFITSDKLITSADFYFESNKLAIFCDGKEFHNKVKDDAIDSKLHEMGIKSLRFSGKEISENVEDVIARVKSQFGM